MALIEAISILGIVLPGSSTMAGWHSGQLSISWLCQHGSPAAMPSARWRSRTWQIIASISAGSTLGIGGMSPKFQWWDVTPLLTALWNEKLG